MIDAAIIERELSERGARLGRPLVVVSTTASTNDDARAAAIAGAPHGAAFVADAQTHGRGRGDHRWHSPPGENVYLSIVLRPALAADRLSLVTLAIGVAVARVVEDVVRPTRGPVVGLKWPNDVLVDRRKIAGVLVEGTMRGDRPVFSIAGVGLNVGTRVFAGELAERATSFAALGVAAPARETLVAMLCVEVQRCVALLEQDHVADLLAEMSSRDVLRGRRIEVGSVTGVASGIAADGRLLVTDDAGDVHAAASGEVVVSW